MDEVAGREPKKFPLVLYCCCTLADQTSFSKLQGDVDPV